MSVRLVAKLLSPVCLLLVVVEGGEWPDPVVDLLEVVEAVAEGPARLHLALRPRVVVVLRELLHQRVELVGELHASIGREERRRGGSFCYHVTMNSVHVKGSWLGRELFLRLRKDKEDLVFDNKQWIRLGGFPAATLSARSAPPPL